MKILTYSGIAHAAGIMNFVVISAALSSMNTNIYLCSRMLFSLSRGSYAPAFLGRLVDGGPLPEGLVATRIQHVVEQDFAANRSFFQLLQGFLGEVGIVTNLSIMESVTYVNEIDIRGRLLLPVIARPTWNGITTKLSWLMPKISPRDSITPITLNQSLPMRRASSRNCRPLRGSSTTSEMAMKRLVHFSRPPGPPQLTVPPPLSVCCALA